MAGRVELFCMFSIGAMCWWWALLGDWVGIAPGGNEIYATAAAYGTLGAGLMSILRGR